jgi:hypothetical protein
VSLGFLQLMEGRRSAHGCIAETRENRQRKRCSYVVTRGTLSLAGHSGINEVPFAGRISRIDELKPGRYELIITAANSVTAANSAGQRSTPAGRRPECAGGGARCDAPWRPFESLVTLLLRHVRSGG